MPPKRTTRATATRKDPPAKAQAKKQPVKATKSARGAQPKVQKNDEMKQFMERQQQINQDILQQLQAMARPVPDKSIHTPSPSSVEQGNGINGPSGSGARPKTVVLPHVTVDSDSESDESETESLMRKDMSLANGLIQARFNKIKGKPKSDKRIENDIRRNRPYAFLDRETQRHLLRENRHPEELEFSTHIEGFTAMMLSKCVDSELAGMLNHAHHVIRDSQVHPWGRVRNWSNEVIFKTAISEWQWVDSDEIVQARNSQYLIQQATVEGETGQPCPEYNRGTCRFQNSHHLAGLTIAHICAFCHALDGAREAHQSRACAKRRSSSNYFKARDDNSHNAKKDKFKPKSHGKESSDDRHSKN